MRKLLPFLALCLASITYAAQQPVNVGTSANDHTGDTARNAFIKLNANDAELYGKFPVSVANGGTGVQTISGVLKGNGTSAFTAAAVSDLLGLFTGTCTISVPLRGDGSCGTIPSSAVTGLAASATTDTTNAANISSGALPAGRLPALTGDCTTSVGTVATTCTKTGGVSFATSATTDTTNAGNISSGTLAAGRGGTGSGAVPTAGQIPVGNAGNTAYAPVAVSGDATLASTGALTVTKTNGTSFVASATTDTTNATNISSGTLASARGGAGAITGALKGNGSGVVSQAACADLSNAAASCSTDATNATNIASGTLAVARGGTGVGTLTTHGVLLGEGTGNVSAVAAMAADTLLQGQGASADPAAVALTNCGDATHALAYSTGTHAFSCQNVTGSSGTPGGSTTQVQFNLTGAFAGDAGFTYVGSSTQQITLGTASVGETIAQTTGTTNGTNFNLNGSSPGSATGVAGAINVTAANGGGTSGNGGALALKSGGSTSGTGGAASLTAGNSASGAGGPTSVIAGNGGATGNGGTVTITAGTAGATSGSGGNVTIAGGVGSSTTGAGGAVSLTGGAANSASNGGNATLAAGAPAAVAGSRGGSVTVSSGAGSSTGTGGSGNDVTIQGGAAGGSGANTGGSVNISGGAATGAAVGGRVTLTGGAVGTAITTGYSNVAIVGGSSGATIASGSGSNADTASVLIAGGTQSTAANNGNDVLIRGGTPGGNAGTTGGNVILRAGGGALTSGNGNVSVGAFNTSTGQPLTWFTLNGNTGAFGVNGASYGSSGNLLMSNSSTTAPSWTNTITAVTTFPAIISGGTKFTTSGCSVSATSGGAAAGTFTLGANTCTVVITINGATGATAPTGWSCQAHDRTAPATLIGGESSSTTTTASITIPAGAGATDVISFSCTGF